MWTVRCKHPVVKVLFNLRTSQTKNRHKAQGTRYTEKESIKQMGQDLTDKGLMVFRLSASDCFVKTYDFHISRPVSVSQLHKETLTINLK